MGDMSELFRNSYADKKNIYCFTRKIENVSSGYSKDRKSLRSPIFMPDNLDGSKWYLKLHLPPAPSRATDNSEGTRYYMCFLHRSEEDSGHEEVVISFTLDMIGERGNIIASRGSKGFPRTFKRGSYLVDGCVFANRKDVTSDRLNWNDDTLAICCRMCKMLKKNEERKQSKDEALTKIGIDRISFNLKINTWDCIDGFSQRHEFSMTSKYSIVIAASRDVFKIQIKDVNEDATSSSYMRGEISLLNSDGIKILTQNGEHLFNASEENNVWNFPTFITKNHFFKDNTKDSLPNETFFLFCEFTVPNRKDQIDVVLSERNSLLLSTISLRDDFRNVLKNMNNSDVELRTANGILRAHKFILSARSPVFDAMFNHNMIESKYNVIEIPDADAETMRYFLEYVYVGTTDVRGYESVHKLLLIANKYQVLSLKMWCASILKSVLSVENAVDILFLADMVDLKPLKNCSLDFIVAHITGMWNTMEWKEFVEGYEEQSSMIFARLSEHVASFSEVNK